MHTQQATSTATSSPSTSRRNRIASRVCKVMSVAVITAALTYAPAAAQAAPSNVLRGMCSTARTASCVAVADDDGGLLVVRDGAGHRHSFRSARAALRYVKGHAPACREEDSPRCWWNASSMGDGVGQSFIVIGGKHGGEGDVFYLAELGR